MRRVVSICVIISLFGCAQQVAPTGGPKDETPPKVLAESPANLSTNFSSQEIIVTFDEFIQLKNTSEQVLISPPVLPPPTFQLKKKSMVLKFEEPFAPNTTYTINFGEAIKDNNEGNILRNYTYVFSTGAELDSMKVKGKVSDVISGEAINEALIMLYKTDRDSLPIDTIPDYFTRTKEDGSFLIEHVGNQPYKLFALKDENANYKFDLPDEQIGFLDSLILPYAEPVAIVQDSLAADSIETIAVKGQTEHILPSYEIKMFVEEDTTQFLKKAYCDYFGKLVFVYNQPVGKLDVSVNDFSSKKQWMIADYNTERDTITVWTTDFVPDTLRLYLRPDKLNSDTAEIIMKERMDEIELEGKSRGKGQKKQVEKFALIGTFSPSQRQAPKPAEPVRLILNHPVLNVNLAKIKLYEDSLRVRFDINSTDSALRVFEISYDWKKDKSYELLVLDSAFSDMYALWNDTLTTSFVGIDSKAFGELSLKIAEAPTDQLIVQLLSSSNKVALQHVVSQVGIVKFEDLNPGKYSLRIVLDKNKNGRWDSGRYIIHQQPEPIKTIESGAEIRANWELELEWNPTQP